MCTLAGLHHHQHCTLGPRCLCTVRATSAQSGALWLLPGALRLDPDLVLVGRALLVTRVLPQVVGEAWATGAHLVRLAAARARLLVAGTAGHVGDAEAGGLKLSLSLSLSLLLACLLCSLSPRALLFLIRFCAFLCSLVLDGSLPSLSELSPLPRSSGTRSSCRMHAACSHRGARAATTPCTTRTKDRTTVGRD